MPMCKINTLPRILMAAAVGVMIYVTPSNAFDPEKTFKADDKPRTILRYGMSALKQGNMVDAIGAFRFGAKKNDLASQWKLARLLQSGKGVKTDHLAAYKLYLKIANRFNERAPHRRDRAFVSSAVVALGRYSLTGIEGSRVKVDPHRAEDYFYRAAALYKDPNAQFELGELYRSKKLGTRQPKSAVRWFGLAAKKGHAEALAQLGKMLYYGEGVKRRPVRGMVLMTRAAAKSGARKSLASIREMRIKAFAEASNAQRAAAEKIISTLNLKRDSGSRKSYALEFGPPVLGDATQASQQRSD